MRQARVTAATLALALAGLAGCTTDVEQGGYPANRLAELEEAVARGDVAAIGALYIEEAQVIPPDTGEAVKGRAAIEAIWQGRIDAGLRAIKHERERLRGEGDKRFEMGTYTSRNAAGEVDIGQYFFVWQKADRRWYVSRQTWASDLQEIASPAAPSPGDSASDPASDPAPDAAPDAAAEVAPEHPEPEVAVE